MVCKRPGHEAGFRGATYIDCPMKPCFLCKMPGTSTIRSTYWKSNTFYSSFSFNFLLIPGLLVTLNASMLVIYTYVIVCNSSLDCVFERHLGCRVPAVEDWNAIAGALTAKMLAEPSNAVIVRFLSHIKENMAAAVDVIFDRLLSYAREQKEGDDLVERNCQLNKPTIQCRFGVGVGESKEI